MARRPFQLPLGIRPQIGVQIFEGAEESGERILQMRGTPPGLVKILMPELIAARDDRRSHGAVFVRALRPCKLAFDVDPNGEPHQCIIVSNVTVPLVLNSTNLRYCSTGSARTLN
jgi:hypothetical protein